MTPRPRRSARRIGAAAVLAGVLALAGCTASGSGRGAQSSTPSSPILETAVTPIPGSAVTTSSVPEPSASSSATPPSSSAPPKPSPTGALTCTTAQLKIGALRGSAAAGQEYAVITFTNTGTVACTMYGYPGVSLRLHNALVGRPAERSGQAPVLVTLAPGARAESPVTDFSSCNAPLSDTVRVYAPDQRQFVDLPLVLRACRIVVDPVTPS